MFNLALLSSDPIIDSSIISELGTLMSTVTGWFTSNPVLKIFLALMFVGVGIGVFKRLRRAI